MSLREFKKQASEDFLMHRNNLRENYSWIENYCNNNYGKGNYLDWLAERFELININKTELINLIGIDYIKSHSFGFRIRPTLKNAVDLLRNILIDNSIEFKYKKNGNRAVLELLQQIRDNLTHQGKYEVESEQYKRNLYIITNASIISDRIVKLIDK